MKTVAIDIATEQAKKFIDLLPNQEIVSLKTTQPQPFYYNAEYFNKEDIEAVLSQKGCDGIRIYHALDNDGRAILMIVGATEKRDLLSFDSGKMNSIENIILCSEENLRCPPMCDTEGLLSSPQFSQ